jgi:hypothetical protein
MAMRQCEPESRDRSGAREVEARKVPWSCDVGLDARGHSSPGVYGLHMASIQSGSANARRSSI